MAHRNCVASQLRRRNAGPRRIRPACNGRPRGLSIGHRRPGPFSAQLFRQLMDRFPHPEMGYRSCLGPLRLGEKYAPRRLESACERALVTGAANYKSVKSILSHSLDLQPMPAEREPRRATGDDNIRGAGYYQ
jgi:hypothetical protein